MGTYRILDAKQHLLGLLLKADKLEQSEDIHTLTHAIEILVQCEHMELPVASRPSGITDFPTDIDFD
jgi:hypothetical protein